MENRFHSLKKLQEAVGLRFNDYTLIQRAFVHRSYLHEADDDSDLQDNQRLEFLGDAVLSFIVSELLFRLYPERREGELTNLRSALVKRESLSRFASELCLGEHLLLGRGEEENGGVSAIPLSAIPTKPLSAHSTLTRESPACAAFSNRGS